MPFQHQTELTILEYLCFSKRLKELGLETVSKHMSLHTMFQILTIRLW